ncbi:MAG: 4Fe-4S binding protein [Proteobacteria bacterium]|nr:4Fe-4S binding protein [Pseudomonadota bacterium]
MQITDAHRALADKYLYRTTFKDIPVPDSLLQLLAYTFTEEEAQVVNCLGFAMHGPGAIARKLKRPVDEVRPILQSLAERILIVGVTTKRVSLYSYLPLYPGVYEAQMVMSEKKIKEGQGEEYFKEFARLFEEFWDEFYVTIKNRGLVERFQIMGVPFGRIITVERAIEATPGLGVIALATDKYSEIAERNKSFALINVCTCRQERMLVGKDCQKVKTPSTVTCALMGLAAEGAIKTGVGRRVSREEFLEARARGAEAGLIAMVDNMKDPLLVCSCCNCCCTIMRVLNRFNSPNLFTQSHFEAQIDPVKCNGCGLCIKPCPMTAIRVENKKASVDPARCIGCGVCVIRCDKNHALTLKERPVHKPPVDNMAEFWLNRYFELKGRQDSFFPKLSLGAVRALSKINPIHLTGPRAPRLGKSSKT